MPQPLVVPLDSPWRTDASHELLRTDPFQVKLSEWLCVEPFETRKIVAVDVWLKAVFASPPPLPIDPGSARLIVPELSATFELPVVPLVSADPLQLLGSADRPNAPTREGLTSRPSPP